MKKTVIQTILAFTVLVAPVFAGNDSNFTYLALGDSVAFGLNPLLLPPFNTRLSPPYKNLKLFPSADQYIGYPEVFAGAEHLLNSKKEVNTSCPGETSGSFLDWRVLDNGCNSPHYFLPPPVVPIPPFKDIGLHTNYSGSQIIFAESLLASNKHINLVTLSIGANDILLVLPKLAACTDNACVAAVLTPVLQTYAGNLGQILTRIRAHYQGTLVLMNYYSPTPALDGVTVAINSVITQVAAQLATQPGFTPVKIADAFTAFQMAAAILNHNPANHDACAAGLVIKLPTTPPAPPCDIHPTEIGRDILAGTVELAIGNEGQGNNNNQANNDGKGSKDK